MQQTSPPKGVSELFKGLKWQATVANACFFGRHCEVHTRKCIAYDMWGVNDDTSQAFEGATEPRTTQLTVPAT